MGFIAASSDGNHASIICITAHLTLGGKAFPTVKGSIFLIIVGHFYNRLGVVVLGLNLAYNNKSCF
jgi:hypothetical protein